MTREQAAELEALLRSIARSLTERQARIEAMDAALARLEARA